MDDLEVPPICRSGDAVVYALRFNRSTWTLGEAQEVFLRGIMPVKNIALRLCTLFGITNYNSARVLLLSPYSEVRLCDLPNKVPLQHKPWTNPMTEERALSNTMHFTEGDFIIIQDESEPLRELTNAEKKSLTEARALMASNDMYSGGYYDYNPWPKTNVIIPTVSTSAHREHKEQGIQIKTHQKREKEKLSLNNKDSDNSAEIVVDPSNTEPLLASNEDTVSI